MTKKHMLAFISVAYKGDSRTYQGISVYLGTPNGIVVNTGDSAADYQLASEFARRNAEEIMCSPDVGNFVMDSGSLEYSSEEGQAGFSFAPYRAEITSAIMGRISDQMDTYRNYFDAAREMLGIDVPIDYIEQSGVLDKIEDERQRELVISLHKKIGEIIDQQNAALDAIDALCERKEQG